MIDEEPDAVLDLEQRQLALGPGAHEHSAEDDKHNESRQKSQEDI